MSEGTNTTPRERFEQAADLISVSAGPPDDTEANLVARMAEALHRHDCGCTDQSDDHRAGWVRSARSLLPLIRQHTVNRGDGDLYGRLFEALNHAPVDALVTVDHVRELTEHLLPVIRRLNVAGDDNRLRNLLARVAADALEWSWEPERSDTGHTLVPSPTEAVMPVVDALMPLIRQVGRRYSRVADELVQLSRWIDETPPNSERDPEAATWGRLAKVAEESGEVIAAHVGATGQNPRKGVTHDSADVGKELLDTATTALAAYEHLTGHVGIVMDDLGRHVRQLVERAGITTQADGDQS